MELGIKHTLECTVMQDVRENILKSAIGDREIYFLHLIGEGVVIRNVTAYLREMAVDDEV